MCTGLTGFGLGNEVGQTDGLDRAGFTPVHDGAFLSKAIHHLHQNQNQTQLPTDQMSSLSRTRHYLKSDLLSSFANSYCFHFSICQSAQKTSSAAHFVCD